MSVSTCTFVCVFLSVSVCVVVVVVVVKIGAMYCIVRSVGLWRLCVIFLLVP